MKNSVNFFSAVLSKRDRDGGSRCRSFARWEYIIIYYCTFNQTTGTRLANWLFITCDIPKTVFLQASAKPRAYRFRQTDLSAPCRPTGKRPFGPNRPSPHHKRHHVWAAISYAIEWRFGRFSRFSRSFAARPQAHWKIYNNSFRNAGRFQNVEHVRARSRKPRRSYLFISVRT